MNIIYTWLHSEKTEAAEALTSKKLAKLEQHCDRITSIEVTFTLVNKGEHEAKACVHMPGTEINAHAAHKDLYKAIDDLTAKLLRQVDDHKRKIKGH